MLEIGHLGELIGTAIGAVIATLATLQAWLKIQGGSNPAGGIRKAELKAAILEHEREILAKIGSEGDATRRQMRDGFDRLERAIREGG